MALADGSPAAPRIARVGRAGAALAGPLFVGPGHLVGSGAPASRV